jgi:succinate dehydrogenase / fumarate reductase cytochrome b subunit
VSNQRPKNLNILTIRLPIPAIASILHRVSGLVLFLFIPLVLWVLDTSLGTETGFFSIRDMLTTPFAKFFTWVCLMPFLYHFVAGIRHLLMDVNVGIELKSGRLSAILTFIITLILILLAGVYLW